MPTTCWSIAREAKSSASSWRSRADCVVPREDLVIAERREEEALPDWRLLIDVVRCK